MSPRSRHRVAALLALAVVLSALAGCATASPPALDASLPTVGELDLRLPAGWVEVPGSPLVELSLGWEDDALPEASVTSAASPTVDDATAQAYLDGAIERLGEGQDRFALLESEQDPYAIDGARSLRFRAQTFAGDVPLEVSVLLIVGRDRSIIAQVVHEPARWEVERPRVDALFDAVVDALVPDRA